jgi:hypothetical protein
MNRFFDSIDFGKLAIYVWVGFTTLYFLVSVSVPFIIQKTQASLMQTAYNNGANQAANEILTKTFSGNLYQNGQVNGFSVAVTQLAQGLAKQMEEGCQNALPIQVASGTSVGVMSVDCFQKIVSQQQAPATPQK